MKNLPDECMILILSYVDDVSLLSSCRQVCKHWYTLLNSHRVWCEKIKNIGEKTKCQIDDSTDNRFFMNQYLNLRYGRNLIQNGSGIDHFSSWNKEKEGGDGWDIESPPVGCGAVPKEAGPNCCFVTSYGKCKKSQVVEFCQFGIPQKLIDMLKPNIHISDWCTSRYDCGSIYQLKIEIYYEKKQMDEIEIKKKMKATSQSKIPEWVNISHVIHNNYQSPITSLKFSHQGFDAYFWAGHYGSKMTGSTIKLHFGSNFEEK